MVEQALSPFLNSFDVFGWPLAFAAVLWAMYAPYQLKVQVAPVENAEENNGA